MTTKYTRFCDICHKKLEEYNDIENALEDELEVHHLSFKVEPMYDLCFKCFEKEFLKGIVEFKSYVLDRYKEFIIQPV